jgi:hypothetical protein
MLNLCRIICGLSLMLTLSGCATMTGSGGVSDKSVQANNIQGLGRAAFCDVAQPLRWSGRDTDETIKQAKLHNQTGITLCKWH